uniref:NADH dehydrogenase-like complex L n=1 Tax=Melianthus villosus TaxID=377280 RepID=A0A0F7CYX9_9ROSI
MSCSLSFHPLKALPSLSPCHHCSIKSTHHQNSKKIPISIVQDSNHHFHMKKSALAIPIAALLATVDQPALAVTGVNNQEDLIWILTQLGIIAFGYFLIAPPIIMNWLRIRWYKRKLLEMYLQFMFVFLFFPAILLWAPFLNFRKFPRDPNMKYPWSTPEDPSQIKNDYRKFPWADSDDYA